MPNLTNLVLSYKPQIPVWGSDSCSTTSWNAYISQTPKPDLSKTELISISFHSKLGFNWPNLSECNHELRISSQGLSYSPRPHPQSVTKPTIFHYK